MLKVSPPFAGYGTLNLARARLLTTFGYPDFRPPQVRAVQAVLSGRDSLIVLPTGGGKSLCFQVPALLRDGLTVVISPLISLMKDQVDSLKSNGIQADFINSTITAKQAELVHKKIDIGELALKQEDTGRLLPLSLWGRWTAAKKA